jgi:four helix bundle protein
LIRRSETPAKLTRCSGSDHASSSGMDEHDSPERPASFEDGQDIRDRAFEFACRVVKFCQRLSDGGGVGRLMVPQLLNCTLSFATMLEEARGAESDADFISKCCISLKECRESWTRLRVCEKGQIGAPARASELVQESDELIAIVTTIVKNKRRNVAAKSHKAQEKKAARGGGKNRPSKPANEFQIPDS